MPSELLIHAVHQGGMHIVAEAGGCSVSMDYPWQPDVSTRFSPLMLLLASLAGCSGSTLVVILERRMQQPVGGLEVTARGRRRDEHPTVFTEIALEFVLRGSGLEPEKVSRALELAEESVCPVWAMLKGGTTITSSFRIVEE